MQDRASTRPDYLCRGSRTERRLHAGGTTPLTRSNSRWTPSQSVEDTRTLGRELRRAIPDTYRAFGQLHSSALAPGALSTSTKELIALAIAVTHECDGCIVAHAEGAARSGATADEVAETMGVAILMNGGPATMYGPRAYQAFQDFTAAKDSTAAKESTTAQDVTAARI